MGWHGAGDIFGKRITTALKDCPGKENVRVVEDILVHTANPGREHYKAVARVLAAASKHSVPLKADKVQFCLPNAKFAGFIVSHGSYWVDPALTDDLRTFPRPTYRTELRSFLGLEQQLGYFRDKITRLNEPLRALNSNRTAWVWTPQHEAAFNETRRTLSGPAYLTLFDPSRPTELLTDASKILGLGFCSANSAPTVTGVLSNAALAY
jgi:hypothetical protein